MKLLSIPSAMLAVLVVFHSIAAANYVSITDRDAFILNGPSPASSTNFGTGDTLLAKNGDGTNPGSFSRKVYLGFDTSGATSSLSNWKLTLDVVDSNAGTTGATDLYTFNVYGLNPSPDQDGWGESTITWDNAPENDGTPSGFGSDATLLGSFTLTGKGIGITTFMSAAFDTFMNGVDGRTTLMISRSTSSPPEYVHAFAARESMTGTAASLMAVPEPTSLIMFGVSGLLLLGGRRRK